MSVSYTAYIVSGFPITAEQAEEIRNTKPDLEDYIVNFNCYHPEGDYYFGIVENSIDMYDGVQKLDPASTMLEILVKNQTAEDPFFIYKKEHFPDAVISMYWGIAVC